MCKFREHNPKPAETTQIAGESSVNLSAVASEHTKQFKKWRTREITSIPGAKTVVYEDSIVRHISNHAKEMSSICLPGAKLSNLENNLQDPEISNILTNASVIILHGGSNDAANQSTPENICAHMKDLVNSVKTISPSAKIIVSGILLRKPVPVQWVKMINAALFAMLRSDQIKFLDPNILFSFNVFDGLTKGKIHLNPKGADELGKIFTQSITEKQSENWKRRKHQPPRP
jgi:GDSL-like Lipase/Acylhydrolase family